MSRRPRRRAWLLAAGLLVAGCSSTNNVASPAGSDTASNSASPGDSTAPTDTGASGTSATDVATTEPQKSNGPATPASTTTTDPTSSDPVSSDQVSSDTVSTDSTPPTADPTATTTFVDVAPTGPCAFTPPVPMGEVAWAQDNQLRALADGGQPTCLVDVVAGTSPIAWSSDAGRALLDPTRSASASGTRTTGFTPNIEVTLSAPTGTATIGIDPVTHRLMRHGSDGAVTDISFLESTDEAIYHPSGKRIIAVGTGAGGAYGIWLSSNLGADPKQILSVEDPSTPVTDLSLSPDGLTLFFIHGFVHRLYVPTLILTEVGVADHQENHLVVSKLEDAQAWASGPCDTTGTVMMLSPVTNGPMDIRTVAGSPFGDSSQTLQPVGWLSGYRVVLAARSSGCDGPADVWIWSPVDGFHHVAHNALAPSVRIPRGPFTDLPDTIEQAAPG